VLQRGVGRSKEERGEGWSGRPFDTPIPRLRSEDEPSPPATIPPKPTSGEGGSVFASRGRDFEFSFEQSTFLQECEGSGEVHKRRRNPLELLPLN